MHMKRLTNVQRETEKIEFKESNDQTQEFKVGNFSGFST